MPEAEPVADAMKTWWLWTEEQRKKFLQETNLSMNYAVRNNWNNLPDEVQKAVIKYLKAKK